jgi:hypothetical protein
VTAPEDRILELALEEVIGGRRPPDLTARILARRPSRWPRVLGAAAVVLLALAAGLWLARPPQLTSTERAQVMAGLELQRQSLAELDLRDPATLARSKAVWQASRDLLDLLEEKPSGWGWVADQVWPLLGETESLDVRQRLLAILARRPGATRDPALLARLREEPAAFDPGTLLALLEAGHAPARGLLEERLDRLPPVPPLVLPAAALALDGDRRGAEVLSFFLSIPALRDAQPAASLAAAAGLRALGDPSAWADTVAALRQTAGDHLQAGELDAARLIVASLVMVPDAVTAPTPRLADLDRHVARRARTLAEELPDAATIRQRLDDLQVP